MTKRHLTPEEAALWRQVMRGTTRLPGRSADVPGRAVPETDEKPAVSSKSSDRPPPPTAPESGSAGGLDAATARRLRRGQFDADARLDLHGLYQNEAHSALNEFIARCHAAGRRRLLVITGKGGRVPPGDDARFMHRPDDGVLRRQVPLWLAQEPNRSLVFAVEPAHKRHGGVGALYVLLRRAERGRT